MSRSSEDNAESHPTEACAGELSGELSGDPGGERGQEATLRSEAQSPGRSPTRSRWGARCGPSLGGHGSPGLFPLEDINHNPHVPANRAPARGAGSATNSQGPNPAHHLAGVAPERLVHFHFYF